MNKTELIAVVAEKAELSKKDAEKAIPKTGETMPIAASKTPKFKAGKALKDMVNA